MKRSILIHYSEIGLKKANKPYFVKKLIKALREKLQKRFGEPFRIVENLERIMINLSEDFVEQEYVEIIGKIFGIQNFQFVYEGPIEIEKLGEKIWQNMPKFEDRPKTFCVRVKRSQTIPYKSIEAEREIGAILLKNGIDMKVKMKNPELPINIEIFNDRAFFSYRKYEGSGGLSPNSSSKFISLISSGIDSPVASYRIMRRGGRIIFVHFHSYPFGDMEAKEQVRDIVRILRDYQFDTKLYMISFGKIQKEIAGNADVPAKMRVVLYRRIMLRVAEKIAYKEKAKGIVTGDNLGQVASQTPENLFAVHAVSKIPLYQPLISFDKEHIICEGEKIGTYDISKLPCKDTCMMFNPAKPELTASVYDLDEIEKKLPIEEWTGELLDTSEIEMF